MVPVLATLSPEQRFAMIGNLADHARETYIAQELRANPDLSLEEARLRAAERMLLNGGVDPALIKKLQQPLYTALRQKASSNRRRISE
ncbi:MAG TPA: hypothetical protein VII92_04465 [Anaerolineae bacterium]